MRTNGDDSVVISDLLKSDFVPKVSRYFPEADVVIHCLSVQRRYGSPKKKETPKMAKPVFVFGFFQLVVEKIGRESGHE